MVKVGRLVVMLITLTAVGTLGFYVIEGWSPLDSLYMAIITLTTVGYETIEPLSEGGKIFVVVYLIIGIGLFFYGIVEIGEILLEAQFRDWLESRRMHNEILQLKKHFIVCGFGRMGQTLCEEFASRSLPFVVVDVRDDVLDACKNAGWPWLLGDATDDQTLQDAGIARARGLATVLPSDAENVYVVLSARLLSPSIQIISRASDERVVDKLERAGANRVVSIYAAGAAKMAQLLINPNVEEFLEVIHTGEAEVDMAEVHVTASAPYVGKALSQTDFSERGIIIVGIRRSSGELLLPPPSREVIREGDFLIVTGKSDVVAKLLGSA